MKSIPVRGDGHAWSRAPPDLLLGLYWACSYGLSMLSNAAEAGYPHSVLPPPHTHTIDRHGSSLLPALYFHDSMSWTLWTKHPQSWKRSQTLQWIHIFFGLRGCRRDGLSREGGKVSHLIYMAKTIINRRIPNCDPCYILIALPSVSVNLWNFQRSHHCSS